MRGVLFSEMKPPCHGGWLTHDRVNVKYYRRRRGRRVKTVEILKFCTYLILNILFYVLAIFLERQSF